MQLLGYKLGYNEVSYNDRSVIINKIIRLWVSVIFIQISWL